MQSLTEKYARITPFILFIYKAKSQTHMHIAIPMYLQIMGCSHYTFNKSDEEKTDVNVSYGNISSVSGIERLVNAKKTSFYKNNLASLPSEIWQLKNLEELDLGYNCLESIDPKVGELINLKSLLLCNNKLESLSSSVGKLKNLLELNLCMNNLRFLPNEIRNIRKLKSINLWGNNISPTGDSQHLGKKELREEFGNIVKLDEDVIENPDAQASHACKNFSSRPVCWNFSNLERLGLSIPPSNRTKESLMELWMKVSENTTEENRRTIGDFIHYIYNLKDTGAYDQAQLLCMNLINAILDALSGSDENTAAITIEELCKSIRNYSHTQIYEMMIIYHLLKKDSPENRDNSDYDCLEGAMSDILSTVCMLLDPEYLIKILTELINSRSTMIRMASHMMNNDRNVSNEDKAKMCIMDSKHPMEVKSITEEFMKYYLLKMGIVSKNEEHHENARNDDKSTDVSEDLYESIENDESSRDNGDASIESNELRANSDESVDSSSISIENNELQTSSDESTTFSNAPQESYIEKVLSWIRSIVKYIS